MATSSGKGAIYDFFAGSHEDEDDDRILPQEECQQQPQKLLLDKETLKPMNGWWLHMCATHVWIGSADILIGRFQGAFLRNIAAASQPFVPQAIQDSSFDSSTCPTPCIRSPSFISSIFDAGCIKMQWADDSVIKYHVQTPDYFSLPEKNKTILCSTTLLWKKHKRRRRNKLQPSLSAPSLL